MLKKFVFSFLFLSMINIAYSQQLFQQTLFMVNPYILNPALAGSEDFVDIKLGHRNQWTGFEDTQNEGGVAPTTSYISAHSTVGKPHEYYRDPRHENDRWHGVGGFVSRDRAGAFSTTAFYGSYSYSLALSKPNEGTAKYGFNGADKPIGVRLTLGAHVGAIQHSIDGSNLRSANAINNNGRTDNTIDGLGDRGRDFSPDASLGLWLYSNSFYAGAAVRRVLGSRATFADSSVFDFSRNFSIMGGYKFYLNNSISLEPLAIVRAEVGSPLSADLNLLVAYDNTTSSRSLYNKGNVTNLHVYGGLTYRYDAAVAVILGAIIQNRYEIAYSFDFTTTALSTTQNGTHEVTLGYRILPSRRIHNAEDHF